MAAGSRRVVWTPLARDALDEALAFIQEDSPAGAAKVLDLALQTAASLEQLAQRGRVVPELGDSQVREVFVFSYRLIYRVKADRVEVVAFLHGARDFERWVRRD